MTAITALQAIEVCVRHPADIPRRNVAWGLVAVKGDETQHDDFFSNTGTGAPGMSESLPGTHITRFHLPATVFDQLITTSYGYERPDADPNEERFSAVVATAAKPCEA